MNEKRGYDRNGMCYECGAKSGEHGPECSYGDELSERYVAIEIQKEERLKKYNDEYKNRSKSNG